MRWLAALVLAIHLAWILWVIVGAFFTRGRPGWTAFHLASLLWGIIVEVGPWPCPVTLLEQGLELRAGEPAWHGSFLVHYLDAIVYPRVPVWLIIACGVAVCCINLIVYLVRFALWLRRRPSGRSH
jgi:predicted permease